MERIKVLKKTSIINELIAGNIITYNNIYGDIRVKDSNSQILGAVRFDTLMQLINEKIVIKFNYAYLVEGYKIADENIQCIGHLHNMDCDKCKYFVKCINGNL